jgi:predicted methyltransferase
LRQHHADTSRVAASVAKALALKGRPARERARDRRDSTGEILTFAAVAPGEVVADFLPFRGYYTRLFADLVGEAGRVYAIVPDALKEIERIKHGAEEIAAFANASKVIQLLDGPVDQAGALPEPVDLFWLSQNYHDLHDPFMGPANIPKFNKAVYAALRPGGRLIVIDHAADEGAPENVTDTKHRISPSVAKREIEAAGFHWDGCSDVLANPADRHAQSVFAHGTRYHTDRFIFRFRKPT